MSVWSAQISPRLCDRWDTAETRRMRALACAGLTGDVVEIGFGSGLNVAYYPASVTRVVAIEPNHVARTLARPRIASSGLPVTFDGRDAAQLPFDARSFDSALSTLTLCTIPDVERAVQEVFRVLKPGSLFHFLEHGCAPDATVARWQHRLEPLQRRIFAGCHLTRDIPALLAGAGFSLPDLHAAYLPGPKASRPWAYLFAGSAHKPA